MLLGESPETLDRLRQVITPQTPFGPPDAARITERKDLLRLLYDPTNRIHREAETSNAPYFLGRKGSGKTAFVTAPKLRDDVTTVELPSADVYQGTFTVVSLLLEQRLQLFPEHAARLWRHLIWAAVLADIARGPDQGSPEFRVVREFVESLNNGEVPRSAERAVTAYLRRLGAFIARERWIGGVGALLNQVEGNGHQIDDAIRAGAVLLARSPKRTIVIVDSLEHYTGHLPQGDYQQMERIAFEGLFRFVGSDGTAPERSFDIRFAFPVELWNTFEPVSANPIKDFHSRVFAHWSARELIALMGTRLAIYCTLYSPETLEDVTLPREANHLSYEAARALIVRVLPPTVTNGIGGPEDTIAYLLRHTQLLPRHLITIMNRVWEAKEHTHAGDPIRVSSGAVVEGVRQGETEVVRDVIRAFSRVFDGADLVCRRIIPNMGIASTENVVHKIWNQQGIYKETGLEFRDFLAMMIQIGCFGRVLGEGTSRYIIGEFEYTRAGSLHLADGEELCLHPLFAEVYNCQQSAGRWAQLSDEQRSDTRPVYPFGSDPNEADYRDSMQ